MIPRLAGKNWGTSRLSLYSVPVFFCPCILLPGSFNSMSNRSSRWKNHSHGRNISTRRLVTNRAFVDAVRAGHGPLTPPQRIALFLFGVTFACAGVLFVVGGIRAITEIRSKLAPTPEDYLSTAAASLVEVILGCSGWALGLRTLRHVIWKAK